MVDLQTDESFAIIGKSGTRLGTLNARLKLCLHDPSAQTELESGMNRGNNDDDDDDDDALLEFDELSELIGKEINITLHLDELSLVEEDADQPAAGTNSKPQNYYSFWFRMPGDPDNECRSAKGTGSVAKALLCVEKELIETLKHGTIEIDIIKDDVAMLAERSLSESTGEPMSVTAIESITSPDGADDNDESVHPSERRASVSNVRVDQPNILVTFRYYDSSMTISAVGSD